MKNKREELRQLLADINMTQVEAAKLIREWSGGTYPSNRTFQRWCEKDVDVVALGIAALKIIINERGIK